MKRRVRKIANFFAFNLLFFALYLNFIHKDKIAPVTSASVQPAATAAFSGTVLVETPADLVKQSEATATSSVTAQPAIKTEENEGKALKLSIN
ncbi:MAG TPA: hypothetical protein VF476_09765 [Chitinophagaceae bacterium]